jgi:hypothetical protein
LNTAEGAPYCIQVAGHLAPGWSDWIDGMAVVHQNNGEGATTELTGVLPDQAALIGILELLYSLGAPLLSVQRLDSAGGRGSPP